MLDTVPRDEPLVCQITRALGPSQTPYVATGEFSATEFRTLLDANAALPLNRRRQEARQQLVRRMSLTLLTKLQEMAGKKGDWLDDYDDVAFYNGISRDVEKQVVTYLQGWRLVTAPAAYRRLLRSLRLLTQAGMDIFEPSELALLAQEAPVAPTEVLF